MSLDYPFYEELKRRKSPAAKWWRLGDVLYYVGLLGAFFSLFGGIIFWGVFFKLFIAFLVFLAIFFLGGYLKSKSYLMAGREGIDINQYCMAGKISIKERIVRQTSE